jgi:hypothetical protein
VAKNIQSALDLLGADVNEPFEPDSAGLRRYINALRELQASHAALDQSIQWWLPLGAPEGDIRYALAEAETLLKMSRRPSGQPANKWVRSAVNWAGFVLQVEGLELTTERKSKWHLLSQIFANTTRDLRHHLTAFLAESRIIELPSLAENPKKIAL